MKFHEESFEATVDIVAAAMEEAEVELSKEGGEKVAEFFTAIYKKLAELEDEDDEDDDDEDEESEDEESEDEESEDEESEDEENEESDEDESEASEKKSVTRVGSYEVYQDKKGAYRFRLKAANGQTIAVSQGYTKLDSCMKGIESVRQNASTAMVKEI